MGKRIPLTEMTGTFNACAKCCKDMDVNPLHLLFPDLMPAEGQEFVRVHGLSQATLEDLQEGAILLDNGFVKLFHTCQHLADDGRCRIYNDRPTICRAFDCGTKSDCLRETH